MLLFVHLIWATALDIQQPRQHHTTFIRAPNILFIFKTCHEHIWYIWKATSFLMQPSPNLNITSRHQNAMKITPAPGNFTKRSSLKITIVHWVKRKSAHSHHITCGDQRPGGARASVGGEIDILHPGPGSNSPGASAADCSPIWRCPVLSPCYNRLLPKNRYPPVPAPTQNPEHQTHTRLRLRHFVRLDTIYFTIFY